MMKKALFFLACHLLIFNFFALAQAGQPTPIFVSDSLENYIKQGMKDWSIPGLAIAIVKDGKTILSKGFGVKDVKTNEPVDENTLFMIGSNTKLFTATALSQVAYNRKMNLDDKVTKYIKGFALYDKNASEMVTIRDLLSHRLGTKTFQGDFTFYNGNLSRQEIMRRMRLMKPGGIFRQDYGYCNACFLTAGEVLPVVTGQPWEVYVYDSIFIRVGMTNTHTLSQGIDQRRNVAKPYTNQFTGQLTELPYDQVDNLGPAGSIVSNVKDLSRWLMMQLDTGKIDGKRVLAKGVIESTRRMNTIVSSRKSADYPTHFNGYGLGVFIKDYNGRQLYEHSGGINGFVTNTCFVPEERLGITILTNNDNQGFFEALRYQILDAYLGVPYINRSREELPGFNQGQNQIINITRALKSRVKGNTPPITLDSYAGTYMNELYGPIIIEKDKQGKKLSINFKGHNKLKADVEYMDNNEWLLTYNNLAYGIFPIKFKTENQKVTSVDIKFNDFIEYDPYTFIKK